MWDIPVTNELMIARVMGKDMSFSKPPKPDIC